MAPPRSIRAQQDASEAPPGEVLDAMIAYADAHQVQQMLHVMLTKLLEAQPLDPFEFLIKVAKEDKELDEIELQAKVNRFDLRRERTKKSLVVALYKRFMALQRTQHDDPAKDQLSCAFLLKQLRLEETREHLKQDFPTHYRDLIQWFTTNEKELKPFISAETFTQNCMAILAGIAQPA